MFQSLDLKFILAIIAVVLNVAAIIPYIRDILRRKTKPHLYTWLIWAITIGTASVGSIYGGGGFASWSLIVGTLSVVAIVALSFKFGTKNITTGDTITLIIALTAVVVWWQLHSPLLSVLMVSVIDGIGYIPTYRKTFADPESETILFWVLVAIGNLFTIFSSSEYNLLTMTYLAVLLVSNTAVVLIGSLRRRALKNQAS